MARRLFLGTVFLLLLLPAVFGASSFAVYIEPLKNQISLDEEALFKVSITNAQDFDDSFRIYYTDVEWDISTDPLSESTLRIPADTVKSTTLKVSPLYVRPGTYMIPINIRSEKTGELKTPQISVNFQAYGDWEPGQPVAVKTILDMPKTLDSRKTNQISLEIRNRYPVNITDLLITLDSSNFKDQQKLSLGPLETRVVTFNINLDKTTPPITGDLLISFISEGQTFKEIERQFTIASYSTFVEKPGTEQRGFLSKKKTFSIKNEGNIHNEGIVKVPTSMMSWLLTSTLPPSEKVREDGMAYFSWKLSLDPQQEEVLTITTTYVPLLLLLIIIIVIALAYYLLRSPIIATKGPVDIQLREGGISEIKLVVVAKNRTPQTITNVHVIEHVPNIAELVNVFKIGTLKPEKVLRHETKGTIVSWVLPELEGYEERVITYTIRSKLTILGSFKLPPTIVKFSQGTWKRATYSPEVNVQAPKEEAPKPL
ncbi:hypothetical protein J4460_02410 [Candidatus Woesearchaeota archaeon]|nr:MAG: hypothetical protein QS99_C0004G0044 [archaeon GW2011_AR4]MBS3129503.1 hypothetical protein [Candidatus Woesearchaeota archaeon]HIH38884.1 hypothetical protein [Candidatus Woesearchaeota archaeon]HIH48694.1 hypothetical protein [Candidatus Woesearchaeota archaeon]HIJ03790.1 hypothetical protein [Candidatus Woesearchaeota archaeon]